MRFSLGDFFGSPTRRRTRELNNQWHVKDVLQPPISRKSGYQCPFPCTRVWPSVLLCGGARCLLCKEEGNQVSQVHAIAARTTTSV